MNSSRSQHSTSFSDHLDYGEPSQPLPDYWYLGVSIPDPSLPKTGLGMQKVHGFYPQDVFQTLEDMVETVTTDDRAVESADPVQVCRLLLNMTLFQRDALNDYARSTKTGSLFGWIKKYCTVYQTYSGSAVESMRGIAEGPLAYDVFLLEGTLSGKFKGDEMTMVEIICDRQREDLQLLMDAYQKKHNITLVDAIRQKYAGRKLENLLLSVLTLQRALDHLPVDEAQIENDILALKDAIEEKDDKILTELLTQRSRPHIAAMITSYASQHGSLRKQIKERWNAKGLLYIIDGAKSKRGGQGTWRDAKLLEETMKGLGTRDAKLQYRVVRAHWNPSSFSAVKQAYKARYGKDLEKRIAGDTSGNYSTVLKLICETSCE